MEDLFFGERFFSTYFLENASCLPCPKIVPAPLGSEHPVIKNFPLAGNGLAN